ncbi:GWxTD domain-containing protein [candidate division KSB1 bacterium]|nr:GWxTD domain-containing protein [candidate division KSB1 bacterium]
MRRVLLFVVIFGFLSVSVYGQPVDFGVKRQPVFGRDLFLFSFYNFAAKKPNLSKAIVHLSVVNDILTFIKQDDGTFVSEYEIIIIIYDKDEQAIAEESIRNTVRAHTFKETNSRIRLHRHQSLFELPPGEYDYHVMLYSNDTEVIKSRKHHLVLRSFDKQHLQTSDLVFAEKLDCQTPEQFSPNLRNIFDDVDSDFAAFFVLYSTETKTLATWQLRDNNNVIVQQNVDTLAVPGEPLPYCIYMRDYIKRPGQYSLTVRLNAGKEVVKMNRNFSVFWGNLSMQKDNLDILLEQLKLIGRSADIEKIKDADKEQQNILYDQFWQKRDPSPGTPVNELKIEFFRRVDFANRNFTELVTGREGWKTDRGRVYIKNGAPTEVEKHVTEINQPHAEIWYYAKLNQRYIFTDRNGTGQYRLVKIE